MKNKSGFTEYTEEFEQTSNRIRAYATDMMMSHALTFTTDPEGRFQCKLAGWQAAARAGDAIMAKKWADLLDQDE